MSSDGDGFRDERAVLTAGPIHYREAGNGQAIVFVHGALANGRLWTETASRLAAGHRCIVPDWPMGSHSEAMYPGADVSPRGVSATIADFLAALDLDDVTLVGNDSGGAVCQMLVTERPERIGRLVLTNCDCFDKFPPLAFKGMVLTARTPGGFRLLVQALRVRRIRSSPLAYGMLTAGEPDDALLRSFIEPALRDAGVLRDGREFAAGMRPADTRAAAAKLPALTIPALIAWGAEDRFFTLADGRRLAATIPDSRMVEIVDASTFVSLDRPGELADAIAEFVSA
ncbi:MAG TPA: alpha/beta hydrolase [Solirubrobacterales bacterium]|jgi:pimeloyl-ACP methyl ester carboxylesterase|nr:alpha/beta hydrolase [Solirubrobacterales bacterium]HEU4802912.1 alpha/beta hydrolase [Solirubrobacterales bacterium]